MSADKMMTREPKGMSPRIICQALNDDEALVTWDQPGGDIVTYELEMYEGARKELRATEWIEAGSPQSCRFSGLNHETVYIFRMRSHFSDGTVGDWSEPKVGLAGGRSWGIRVFMEMEDAIMATETVESSISDTLCVVEDNLTEEDGTTVRAFYVHLNDAELMEDGGVDLLEHPDSGEVVWQKISPAC